MMTEFEVMPEIVAVTNELHPSGTGVVPTMGAAGGYPAELIEETVRLAALS